MLRRMNGENSIDKTLQLNLLFIREKTTSHLPINLLFIQQSSTKCPTQLAAHARSSGRLRLWFFWHGHRR